MTLGQAREHWHYDNRRTNSGLFFAVSLWVFLLFFLYMYLTPRLNTKHGVQPYYIVERLELEGATQIFRYLFIFTLFSLLNIYLS
jgi:hypothetical protein